MSEGTGTIALRERCFKIKSPPMLYCMAQTQPYTENTNWTQWFIKHMEKEYEVGRQTCLVTVLGEVERQSRRRYDQSPLLWDNLFIHHEDVSLPRRLLIGLM